MQESLNTGKDYLKREIQGELLAIPHTRNHFRVTKEYFLRGDMVTMSEVDYPTKDCFILKEGFELLEQNIKVNDLVLVYRGFKPVIKGVREVTEHSIRLKGENSFWDLRDVISLNDLKGDFPELFL